MNQVADVQITNDIAIAIHKFETVYRKGPSGELIEVDMVHYSPAGDNKSVIIREVRRMSQVLPLEEAGDNIAYIRAHRLWNVIEPSYSHWRSTNALPENGTPLAAWAGVTPAQAQVLKGAGLRSVEDIASASDIVLGKTGLANVLMLRDQAQKYLASEDTAKTAAVQATLEAENRELKEQMAELQALMREMRGEDAPRKRGRPRKEDAADAIEAVA
jgi:hypothetical protein